MEMLSFCDIFITGCSGSCQNEPFQCSQWWQFRQNDIPFQCCYSGPEQTDHGQHDDVIKWKHFPRYWPSVRGIHRSPRPVTRSPNVFFDLRLNKRLRKQSWGWWFEALCRPLGRHCNVFITFSKPLIEFVCSLTHWVLVTHMCVSEPGHCWFQAMTSTKCWFIVNWIFRNKFQ